MCNIVADVSIPGGKMHALLNRTSARNVRNESFSDGSITANIKKCPPGIQALIYFVVHPCNICNSCFLESQVCPLSLYL